MRRYRNTSPYFTTARFESTCPDTGKKIKVGDEIAYYPATKKAYHSESRQAADLRGIEFAGAYGMADANW